MYRRINLIFTVITLIVVAACGSNSKSESTKENDKADVGNIEDSMEISQEDIQPPTADEIVQDENKVWQIDDYVSEMLDSKVYESQDDIDYSSLKGPGYYYEELDIPGGFAKVTGAFEGWMEFVLYRMDDGNDLVGKMSVGCGPVCSYDFEFGIYANGKLVSNNPDIFPKNEMKSHQKQMQNKILKEYDQLDYPDDVTLIYNFPQKGTDMKVDIMIGAEEVRTPLVLLNWNGNRFRIKEKYTEIEEPQY